MSLEGVSSGEEGGGHSLSRERRRERRVDQHTAGSNEAKAAGAIQ